MRPAGAIPADRFFQFSLLSLVATGFAAVVWTGRLDRTTAIAAGAALIARAMILVGWIRIPLPDWATRVLTIVYIGFYPFDLRYISGSFLGTTVRLVFFLAAIKLLTAKTGRDYLYLGLIALLELLSAAMLTSSAAVLAFLVLFLLFATAARTRYEVLQGMDVATRQAPAPRSIWKLAWLSVALTAGIASLGLVLFFVVPRAAGAYLARLPATGESMLGFSEEIFLGNIGRLKKNPRPVLRVRILEGRPPKDLKWRGGTLQHFDGIRWSNRNIYIQNVDAPQGHYQAAPGEKLWWSPDGATRLRYQAIRAPMDSDAVFVPGSPEVIEGDFLRLQLTDAGAMSVPGSRWRMLRYEGVSVVGRRQPDALADRSAPYPNSLPRTYLQLPQLDPRILQLARYITESQTGSYWRAVALEHYLRTEFGYTLDLPAERPADPLADFLFRRKKGHCEYFASAMTVMLRSIGIPARLVNGFLTGIYNPVSHYYTIRASDAHAWVEAYFPALGWVTFDPTPPDPRAGVGVASSWLYLDALETFWSDWIVQYDLGRQLSLARAVQARWYDAGYEATANWDRGWRWIEARWRRWKPSSPGNLASLAVWPLVAAALLWLIAWAWPRLREALAARRIQRGRGSREDCALLYARALHRMSRWGFARDPSDTAGEFAAACARACPERRAALLRETTLAYERARFGRDAVAGRELAGLVRRLEAAE